VRLLAEESGREQVADESSRAELGIHGVVERDARVAREVGQPAVEVAAHAAIGVVAVDPEQRDRPVPLRRDLLAREVHEADGAPAAAVEHRPI